MMHPSPSARVSALLIALALAFGAAFVLAPGPLAGGGFADQRALTDALDPAFVDYWNSGGRALPPDLAGIVDYWSRYHLVKAVCAALLLTVLALLAVRLWHALPTTGRLPRLAAAWALVTLLTTGAAALLMANVQGTIAPFSSVLSLLPFRTPDSRLTIALGQVRQQLTNFSSADHRTPQTAMMVADFGRYHAVIAVLTAILTLVLLGMGVATWRRLVRTAAADRRTRRLLGTFGALLATLTIAAALVLVANTCTAANPAPALLAFFNGGW
ncbi:hypothetical protein [Kitasatospora mediocidica]|uniref:hypothetical protein n=1 Tax=Kitasatospora mediocidica TaxID=58352 RepID=UPI000AFEF1CF|nr:hypothetical protein [Kitasatospora mediocidica]